MMERLFRDRNIGDYSYDKTVDTEESERDIRDAETMIAAIANPDPTLTGPRNHAWTASNPNRRAVLAANDNLTSSVVSKVSPICGSRLQQVVQHRIRLIIFVGSGFISDFRPLTSDVRLLFSDLWQRTGLTLRQRIK